MHAVRIEQEDGTEHAVRLGLDDAAEGGEHLGQLDSRRDHLQELPLAGQDRLRPPSLAEVTDVAGEHGRRIGADAGDGQLDGKLGPVRAHRGQLDPLADRRPLSRGQVVGQAAPVAVTEGGRHDQLAELAADRLAPRVAEGPLGGRVELQDLPGMVHGDDAIERRLQDRPHAGITLAPILEEVPEEPQAARADDLDAGRAGLEEIVQDLGAPRDLEHEVDGMREDLEVVSARGDSERPGVGEGGRVLAGVDDDHDPRGRPVEEQIEESRSALPTAHHTDRHTRGCEHLSDLRASVPWNAVTSIAPAPKDLIVSRSTKRACPKSPPSRCSFPMV